MKGFKNKDHQRKFFDCFRRITLVVGKKYLVNSIEAIFIRSTKTGYNFLDIKTNEVILNKSLYRSKKHKDLNFYLHYYYNIVDLI